MTPTPRPIRRTVQTCLRTMLNSKMSRPMGLAIQHNLRHREQTQLLAMVKEHKTVQALTLLAVSRALKM